jgi:hypothetical protein
LFEKRLSDSLEISAPFFLALVLASNPPTIFSFLTTFFTALLNGAEHDETFFVPG